MSTSSTSPTTLTVTATNTEVTGGVADNTPPTHTMTKSGVKIPLLKNISPEDSSPRPGGTVSQTVIIQSESGAPGPKPIMLPGMPGKPVSPKISGQAGEGSLTIPYSPFKTPRRLLSPEKTTSSSSAESKPPVSPRRPETIALPKTEAMALLKTSSEDFEKTIDLLSASLLSLGGQQSSSPSVSPQTASGSATTSTTTSTSTSATATPVDQNVMEVSKPVLQIRKLSFRMKQSDQLPNSSASMQELLPTPRKQGWSVAAPSTADRIIKPISNFSADRPKVISEAAKIYALTLRENLLFKKKDIPAAIGRDDTKLPYESLPGTLKPYYAKKSSSDSGELISIVPLLRTLFKSQIESTAHWKKASQELVAASALYEPSIATEESDKNFLEKERGRLDPVAAKIINCLLPSVEGGKGTVRRLDNGIFSKDFLRDVIFTIDHEFVDNCKFNTSLSVRELNNLRCLILADVMVSTFLEPLLLQKFPKNPSKSQLLMQSLLISHLKKAVNEMVPDFLEKSQECMPEALKKFLQDKSLKEQKAAVEEQKQAKEAMHQRAMEKFSLIRGRGAKSTRNLEHFQKLSSARDRPGHFKPNHELFEQIVAKFGLANVGESLGNFLAKEMRKWLDMYTKMQDPSDIRADLLASLKIYANELAKSGEEPDSALKNALDALTKAVAQDVEAGAVRRMVDYDVNLLDRLADMPVSPRRTIDDAAVLDEGMMMTVTMGLDLPELDDTSSEEGVAQSSVSVMTSVHTGTTTTTTTSSTTTTATTTTTASSGTGVSGGQAHSS